MSSKQLEKLIERLSLLIVDENQYMRKLTRMMLMNIGARSIFEAGDGLAALDIVRSVNPDIMLMDWDIPVLSGPQIMHLVRSPGVFPKPGLPVIMLTDRAMRSQVQEAMRLGVHELIAAEPLARVDYVEMVDAATLQPVAAIAQPTLLAVAAFIGKTRLIDNVVLPAR